MTGVTVDDVDYVYLVLSIITIGFALLAAKWRESDVLVRVVLSVQLGLLIFYWWNSTLPSSVTTTDSLYTSVGIVGASALVFVVWHQLGSLVVGIVMLGVVIASAVAGRDKVSSLFGGLDDDELAAVFVGVVVACVLGWWAMRRWVSLWTLVSNLLMGFGLGLGVSVVEQEIAGGNTDLDLLDVGAAYFWPVIIGSEVVYLLLYYRHRFFPCWFKPPPLSPPPPPPSESSPPPETATSRRKRRKKTRYSRVSSSDSDSSSPLPRSSSEESD